MLNALGALGWERLHEGISYCSVYSPNINTHWHWFRVVWVQIPQPQLLAEHLSHE